MRGPSPAGARRPGASRRLGLLTLLAPLAGPLAAQEVSDCDPAPPVTALVEPWEATSLVLAEGAVRLAVIEGEEETRRLLVLTLPPPPPPPDPSAEPDPDAGAEDAEGEAPVSEPAGPPPERRCRIVTEGGLGFADLDLAGLAAEEDPEAGTLTLRLPALGFIPESTELSPHILLLTFGAADDSLVVAIEAEAEAE